MHWGFENEQHQLDGVTINAAVGGVGYPLLLLHGYPETHAMWRDVAPQLLDEFTVVCPDLRGYGDSSAPASDDDHVAYAKRTMAADQLALMAELGFDRFAVVGHDRGARVALRLALDHPQAISHLGALDIVPTATIYSTLDQQRATTVWRYFFLVQPFNLPERLIGSDPEAYLRWTMDEWCGTPGVLDEAALVEYARCFDGATIHASCEDYRAGATVDLRHDREDVEQQLDCPVLLLWSASGIGRDYDVLRIWGERAARLTGHALDCGHFLAEERPDEVAAAIRSFLSDGAR